PHVVDAEAVGQLDLLQRVEDELLLLARLPRPGKLVLVEDAKPHVASPFMRSRDCRAAQPNIPFAISEDSSCIRRSLISARVACSSGAASAASSARCPASRRSPESASSR